MFLVSKSRTPKVSDIFDVCVCSITCIYKEMPMKKILLYSISIFLIGCGINSHEGRDILIGSNPTGMTREEYMNTLDSAK